MRSSAFFLDGSLVDEEYLGQSVVRGLHRGAALDDGADLELHSRIVGGRSESGTLTQLAIYLIARLIGVTIEIGESDGCRRNDQFLTVGHDGDLWHLRCFQAHACLHEADAVEVEETIRTLWSTRTTPAGTLWSLYLRTLSHEVDGMLACQSLNGRHIPMIQLSRA